MLNVLRLMFPYLRPFWKQAVFAAVLAFPLSAIKAYEAYLVKDIFDKGFSPDSTFEDARNLALILVGLGILNYPLRYYHYFGLRQVVDQSTRLIRSAIYKKFQVLPAKYYSQQKQGTLVSTIMADTAVFSEAFKNSLEVVREPVTALSLLGVAFYHDWQLTLIIFAIMPR
jgi:ATP-binding cassette, subfamily B, bacterial MsbA